MSDTNILKLNTLQIEYQNKIKEYETANATYIAGLQTINTDSTTNSFVIVPGSTYWGTDGITEGPAATIDDCKAMCSSNKLCQGAIFNSDKSFCWVRSGQSSLTTGTPADNAIITQTKQNINNLDAINQELIDINNQIIVIYTNNPDLQQNKTSLLKESSHSLENNYKTLNIEKKKIEKLLDQYNDADQEYQNQSIAVDQSSFVYYLWLVVAIFAFLLAFKMFAFPEIQLGLLKTGAMFIFLTLFIFATIQLKNPMMYALWLLIILIGIIMKLELF